MSCTSPFRSRPGIDLRDNRLASHYLMDNSYLWGIAESLIIARFLLDRSIQGHILCLQISCRCWDNNTLVYRDRIGQLQSGLWPTSSFLEDTALVPDFPQDNNGPLDTHRSTSHSIPSHKYRPNRLLIALFCRCRMESVSNCRLRRNSQHYINPLVMLILATHSNILEYRLCNSLSLIILRLHRRSH